jgi:outer membrane protein assembly factor BamE (lipoprotein component of BamABCDE complex)
MLRDLRIVGFLVSALALLPACEPIQYVNGYMPDDALVGELKTGVDDKASVLKVMGSPSNISTFGTSTWYYIARKTEQFAVFKTEVLDQQVLAIDFDDTGVVSQIRRYTVDDMKEIAISERVTPTRGKELGVFQQLFGNVGRFSHNQDTTGR